MNDLTARKKRRIKSKLCDERPTIWIGKSGASEELLKEIAKQLDREEMVKVRILISALAEGEARQIASKVAGQTSASLVEVRGLTFMLYKSRRK